MCKVLRNILLSTVNLSNVHRNARNQCAEYETVVTHSPILRPFSKTNIAWIVAHYIKIAPTRPQITYRISSNQNRRWKRDANADILGLYIDDGLTDEGVKAHIEEKKEMMWRTPDVRVVMHTAPLCSVVLIVAPETNFENHVQLS